MRLRGENGAGIYLTFNNLQKGSRQTVITSTSSDVYSGATDSTTEALLTRRRTRDATRLSGKVNTSEITNHNLAAVKGAVRDSQSVGTLSRDISSTTPPRTVTATSSGPVTLFATQFSGTATTTQSATNKSSKAVSTTGREATVLRGWDSGSFCDELLHNTFSQLVPVCEATHHSEQSPIMCKKNPRVIHMIQCSLTNVLIRPKKLFKGVASDLGDIVNSEGIELLVSDSIGCKSPNMNGVYSTTESGDHVRKMVEESVRHPARAKSTDCQRWINETTFVYLGMNVHIYFEFIALYNAYKSILDEGNIGSYKVLRVAQHSFDFVFADFEKLLFPGIEFVQNMTEESVCFKRLVLPPRCYSSLVFVCKMNVKIHNQCFHCDGKGRTGTAFRSFRTQVLKACSFNDTKSPITGYQNPKKIAVILRKSYQRYAGDKRTRYDRVLSNNDELLTELQARFIKANIVSFHGEDLPVCEQIRMVHDADIFIGVHGAGLVHAWWLQDNALLFEIVPSGESNNPTFKMLTTLVGINYKGYRIGQGSHGKIKLDVKNFISALNVAIRNGVE